LLIAPLLFFCKTDLLPIFLLDTPEIIVKADYFGNRP
jgi:hypothetical protein